MGGGSYDFHSRSLRTSTYKAQTNEQTFQNRSCPEDMSPKGLTFRESRDSEEHPNSLPIIIGLDVTGSMGSLPQHIVRDGLPNIIKKLHNNRILDPQILFLGIGDHVYDSAPIQVGQFESSDDLLDRWLTGVWLEGGGGGNSGESYLLAWLIAGKYTAIDSMEKRGQKGFLFTIGDEPLLDHIAASSLNEIFGGGFQSGLSIEEIYKMASEKYHVVHFFTTATNTGSSYAHSHHLDATKKLLGQNFIVINSVDELDNKIAEYVATHLSHTNTSAAMPTNSDDVSSEETGAPSGEVL